MNRIACGSDTALQIKVVGAPSTLCAIVTTDDARVRLTVIDEDGQITVSDLDYDTYASTDALADAINAQADWYATKVADVLSAELNRVAGLDALNRVAIVDYPHQQIANATVCYETGLVELPTGWASTDLVIDYDAGFDVIPDDIELITCELTAEAYHLGRRDTNLKSERIGDYSQTLASRVSMTDSHLARLRPYINLPVASG